MIKFKKADWIIQITLIITGFLLFLFGKSIYVGDFDFTISYMIVGGWQLISTVVHFFLPAEARIPSRKWYLVLTSITLFLGALFLLKDDDNLIGFLLVILFWTPCLAFFYLGICITETKNLTNRKA